MNTSKSYIPGMFMDGVFTFRVDIWYLYIKPKLPPLCVYTEEALRKTDK